MKTPTLVFAALLAASQACGFLHPTIASREEKGTKIVARDNEASQRPSTFPIPDASTSQGCYSSAGNLTRQEKIQNLSSGSCHNHCKEKKFWVMGLHGADCYCGFVYPPLSKIADDPNCNYPCPAYGLEACGGLEKGGFWSIYNTGTNIQVENQEDPSSSSNPGSSSTKSPTSEDGGSESDRPSVIIQTQTTTPTSDADGDKSSGPNVAGIAAGTVVGVIVAAALIGGAIFFMRRKRNAEIEEEHRRNAAVNAFINGSKPPGSSGSISMTDARLDPVLSNRRMSDGSIADNEDYSRRILRVTNA
ncbi:hypothetical protein CDD81_7618 [Ophiocordyceps australis]|uniref:WSC domain-containing protein n=1 Tax=Ophiocordyceps australis TaxID=1399860 RepID=A0A2C5Y4A4_9HYPO|nr:hypothetical protein CDD81_7618 [Ophiocordyceps australis]